MLYGVKVNGEIEFKEENEIDNIKDIELTNYNEILEHSCIYGDIPENANILIRDEIVRVEDGEIIRFGINIHGGIAI